MNPVLLHEDGSRCEHEENPKSSSETGIFACSAGVMVTHVEFNGRVMTVEESVTAFLRIAKTLNDMMPPLISAFTKITEAVTQTVKTSYSGEENQDVRPDQARTGEAREGLER